MFIVLRAPPRQGLDNINDQPLETCDIVKIVTSLTLDSLYVNRVSDS